MSSSDRAAVVFTSKSIGHICSIGGTQSWRMHQSHFGAFNYVICARNRRHEGVEGPEEHRAAFLLGKVRDIVPATDCDDPGKPRFLIRMTEAALIHNKPNFWNWGRWPVHYDSLDALGIDPANYEFKPLANLLTEMSLSSGGLALPEAKSPLHLGFGRRRWDESIAEAKASLAAELGVKVAAIEIAVRI